MQNYVLGFAIADDLVLLIEKQRPKWQKGKLNGVGGKVEDGESSADAMRREFLEETGVLTFLSTWRPFASLHGEGYQVECFVNMQRRSIDNARSVTDEKLIVSPVSDLSGEDLPYEVIHNVEYLVRMALDPELVYADVYYVYPKAAA